MKSRLSHRRFQTGRRLRVEFLESRQMLSATVTAVLSGGNLTLTGNKNAAYVEVHETAADTLLITGLSGTKITYGTNTGTSESVSGVTGNLTVNLPGSGSGTQSFELDSASGQPETTIFGNLAITMGNAANTVIVQGPSLGIGGGMSISTGSGNQTIQVGKVEDIGSGYDVAVEGGSLSVSAGAGNFSVSVVDTGVYEGSLGISLGSGNGKVVVGSEADTAGTDVFIGANLSICLGNGNGTVQVVNSEADNNLSVVTGSGNQTISIGAETQTGSADVTVGGYLYVGTCPGNSTVTILNTTTSFAEDDLRTLSVLQSSLNPGDLAVELGAGNNTVTIGSALNEFPSDVNVQGNAYVETGTGNSIISLQSASIDGNLLISHQSGASTITIGAYDPYSEGSDVSIDGNATITTSTGNAAITIGGTAENDSAFIYGNLTIQTGTGNATISLTNDSVIGNVSITTGSGNATVSLLDDTFYSNLAVTLGSGNGSLSIKGTSVDGATTLNGGGNGTLYYDGTDTFAGGLSQSHFKKVTT